MNNTNKNAINTIAESIVSACKDIIAKASFDRSIQTTVVEGPNASGRYGLIYDGNVVYVPNYSGQVIRLNDKVIVTLPSNSYKNMYISAVMR